MGRTTAALLGFLPAADGMVQENITASGQFLEQG